MRVTISFDSATTEQVRALSVALNQVLGNNNLTLGVEGPECWHGETPKLNPNQFADVVGRLVKFEDRPLSDLVDDVKRVRGDWGGQRCACSAPMPADDGECQRCFKPVTL